jgi:hypothetical protein
MQINKCSTTHKQNQGKKIIIISTEVEKACDKIQHSFMMKTLKKLKIQRTYLNIIKVIHDTLIVNLTLSGENLKLFPVKSRMRKGCPPFPLVLNIVLDFLVREIRQKKEIKGIQIEKEEIKLSLFADDAVFYIKDIINYTKILLYLINMLSKVAKHKINTQKSVTLLYTNNEQSEKQIKKTTAFMILSKN